MKTERSNFFTCYSMPDKERKNLLILDLIRKRGLVSRTEISRITGINIVSVSNYITGYIEKNIVVEKGLDISTGGRKPELVELNTRANNFVGVAIKDKGASIVVTDLAIKVLGRAESAVPNQKREGLIKVILPLIDQAIEKAGVRKDSIKAIGVGLPDDNMFSVGGEIEKYFGIEALEGSHALCAAFGEKRLNKDADGVGLLYMHSDLGSGVVIRKDTCVDALSADEFSEEAKYLKPWDKGLSIVSAALKEISKGVGTSMVDIVKGDAGGITREVVIEAALRNDRVSLDIIQSAALNLGLRGAYLVNLFNPEVIVIGGGMETAGKIVFDSFGKMVRKLALRARGEKVRIIPSVLGEDAVGLGASSLAAREIFLRA